MVMIDMAVYDIAVSCCTRALTFDTLPEVPSRTIVRHVAHEH